MASKGKHGSVKNIKEEKRKDSSVPEMEYIPDDEIADFEILPEKKKAQLRFKKIKSACKLE